MFPITMRSKWIILGLTLFAPLAGMSQISSSRNRIIYVNVSQTNGGRPLQPLTTESIRVTVGNNVVPVIGVNKDTATRRIAILLDSSSSMEIGKPEWFVASSIAAAIAATAPKSAELSFVSFGSDKDQELRADKDHKGLVEQITALRDSKPNIHSHRSNLWDSVANTTRNPLPLQTGDVIFVVTDGGDAVSHIHPPELDKEFYRSGIRVFGFALQSANPRTDEELAGPGNVRDFARRTGGDCLIIRGQPGLRVTSETDFSLSSQYRQEIQNTIVRFLEEAVQPYKLELAPSAAALSGKLKVEIVENGIERKDLVVLAPKRLFPTD